MSYEVWGDGDDGDYASISSLIDNGWWDEDTVQRVKDAVQALRTETVYENGRKAEGISVRFFMRLSVLSAEVGLMEETDPIVKEARAVLGGLREAQPADSWLESELLACLKHAVHWHDQLSPQDIARFEAAIAKAEA